MIHPVEELMDLVDPLRPYMCNLAIGVPTSFASDPVLSVLWDASASGLFEMNATSYTYPGWEITTSTVELVHSIDYPSRLRRGGTMTTSTVERYDTKFIKAFEAWALKMHNIFTADGIADSREVTCPITLQLLKGNQEVSKEIQMLRCYPRSVQALNMNASSDTPCQLQIQWYYTTYKDKE